MPLISPLRSACLLLLLCICGLASCDKGEVTPPTPAPTKKDTCLVVKATETRTGLSPGTTPMIFEYDAQKRLIKKRYPTFETNPETSLSFEYDASGRLVKLIAAGPEFHTYTDQFQYDSQGRLLKSTRQQRTYSVTNTNTYDSNGNLFRTDTENSEGQKSYSTYTYANGNLVEAKSHSNGAVGVTTYEYYLDKPNVVKEELLRVYNLSASNKNLLKTVHTGSDLLGDINFTYEFTDKGYLAKVNSQSPAFNTTSVYEYNCD